MKQSPEHRSKSVHAPAPHLGIAEGKGKIDKPDSLAVVRRWDYPTHAVRPAERHE